MALGNSCNSHWWQRRSGRIVAEFDALCVCIIIVILTVPALADIIIPVPGTRYVVSLGDIPPWIAAAVLAVTWWEARSARKHAADALKTATTAVTGIDTVRKQTDGMMEQVAAMSKKVGNIEGRKDAAAEVAEAKVIARTDAVADAKAAADVRAVDGNTKASSNQSIAGRDRPLPVADDRTATATERTATASERVADAAERSADKVSDPVPVKTPKQEI